MTITERKRVMRLWNHALDKGLTPMTAYVYTLMAWNWELISGQTAPQITSGRRSRAHQLRLRRRFDAGDRRGLVVRPALKSAHVEGIAFDIRSGSHTQVFAAWIKEIGGRWGGDFSTPDPVHFDLRGIPGATESSAT